MSLPHKGLEIKKEAKWSIQSKSATLNPNAAEFVPSSLKPANESNDTFRLDLPGTSRKVVLDRSDTTLHNSDDEAHQYWRRQLPDDITPDFAATGKDDLPGPELLRLAGLSLFDENVGSRVPESANRQTLHAQLNSGLTDELGYSDSMFHGDQSSVSFTTPANDSWDNQYIKAAQHMSNGLDDGYHLNGSSSAGFVNNSFIDHLIIEDSAINHVEFLALQFPGFSAESLAEVYYANSCDLNLTIEILTQLELQMDGGFTQNQNLKAMATPNLNALDFPALPVTDSRNTFATYSRGNIQQAEDLYSSPSSLFRGPPDFASAVRKLASQDNGAWKHERNSSVDTFGSSGVNRQLLANSYKGNGKLAHENKLQGVGAARAGSVWLETGDAVANVYSTSREEARDFARLRNACFQQAREAYLIGNKALAKELGDKGKWYNLQMKEAHAKARETIYRQRNPLEFQGYGRGGQERMIDLHGLHVNEAIHVLKHELATLRNAARSGGHRLQVLICVGTGHHTKGARTPARLPIAVEQYLVEEGLHYSQSQPGLLRVVIY